MFLNLENGILVMEYQIKNQQMAHGKKYKK